MAHLTPIVNPTWVFEDRTQTIYAAADIPNSELMVTSSEDRIVRLWDLKTGKVSKQLGGHTGDVMGLAVSRDGELIATGDENGELIAWQAKTGASLTRVPKAHGSGVRSLDFSPDNAFVVTASAARNDQTIKFWNTKTWEQAGYYACGDTVRCVRYARSSVHALAVATDQDIQIYADGKLQTTLKGHSHGTLSLAWSPDAKRLLSGGDDHDPSIREWETSSWTQVGEPWTGHTYKINSIAVHSTGTHAVSASSDNSVRLWQLSDKQTVAIFQHTSSVICAAFSAYGAHILSGGYDKKVSVWTAPAGTLPVLDIPDFYLKEVVTTVPVTEYKVQESTITVETPVSSSHLQQSSLTTVQLQSVSHTPQPITTVEQTITKVQQSVVNGRPSESVHTEQSQISHAEQSLFNSQQSLSGAATSVRTEQSQISHVEQSLLNSQQSLSGAATSVRTEQSQISQAEQSLSRAATSVTKSDQSVLNGGQTLVVTESVTTSPHFTLQPVLVAESSDSRLQQSVLTTTGADSKSLQSVLTSGSSESMLQQSVLTTTSSDSKSLQPVLTIGNSDSKFQQSVLTTPSSNSNSQQSSLTTLHSQSVLKAEQPIIMVEQTITKVPQSLANGRSFESVHTEQSQISHAEQSLSESEQSLSRAATSVTKSDQSVLNAGQTLVVSNPVTGSLYSKSLQPVLTAGSSDSRIQQSVSTTASSDSRSQQSSLTTVHSQSVLEVEQPITEFEQSAFKAEQHLSKAEQYAAKSKIKVERVVSKTLGIATAELLAITNTTQIATDAKNFASYANRSFILARKLDWDSALHDATKSLVIRASIAGYIAKGIALCGKQRLDDARTAFDLAFTFTQGNMDVTVFLYLIKAR
ncbi:WD40-repeat-containing domain protein [Suillus variegatus]|nr:WD40-repeat-containing domain protein [Suillus variegatus]